MTSKEIHQLIGSCLFLIAAICGIVGGFVLFGLGAGLITTGFILFIIGMMYISSTGA